MYFPSKSSDFHCYIIYVTGGFGRFSFHLFCSFCSSRKIPGNRRCDDESSSSNSSPTPRKFRSKLAPLAFGFSADDVLRTFLDRGGGVEILWGEVTSLIFIDFLVDLFWLGFLQLWKDISKNTSLERNMFPENECLEDVFPIEIYPF